MTDIGGYEVKEFISAEMMQGDGGTSLMGVLVCDLAILNDPDTPDGWKAIHWVDCLARTRFIGIAQERPSDSGRKFMVIIDDRPQEIEFSEVTEETFDRQVEGVDDPWQVATRYMLDGRHDRRRGW